MLRFMGVGEARTLGSITAICIFASLAHAETPPTPGDVVSAYVRQLAAICGPSAGAISAQRVDLNGDRLDDWVVDAACMRKPTQPTAQVTVFVADAQGHAFPAFQQAAVSSNIERAAGKPRLILTLAGEACGEGATPATRCDRVLVWKPTSRSFDLAPVEKAKAAKVAGK